MATVFAQNNFGDTMSDGLAGPMGLLIIVLLAIATVFLIRNMNSRLRRLPGFTSKNTPGTMMTFSFNPSRKNVMPSSSGFGSFTHWMHPCRCFESCADFGKPIRQGDHFSRSCAASLGILF